MTQAKHTPGPWLADRQTVYALDERGVCNRMSAFVQGGFVLRSHALHPGHSDNVKTSQEEIEANTHLIAAAPDMRDALALVRMSVGWQYLAPETRDIVDDALAKAEGRA